MEPLNEQEVQVLALRRSGKTLREIGEASGHTHEWAHIKLSRAMRKERTAQTIEKLLVREKIIEAAKIDAEESMPPSRIHHLLDFFNHDFRQLLMAEPRLLPKKVRQVGPKAVEMLLGILEPYGLRLGMSEEEIAAVDSRAASG